MEKPAKQKSPVTFYGSGGYTLLCFGKSSKKPFSISVAADVLAGKFRCVSDARQAAKKLQKHGLMDNVNDDFWLVTKEGIKAIDSIAESHRKLRDRLIGAQYIEAKKKEMRFGASTSVDDFMDEPILEEIYLRTIQARKRKSAQRTSKKPKRGPL